MLELYLESFYAGTHAHTQTPHGNSHIVKWDNRVTRMLPIKRIRALICTHDKSCPVNHNMQQLSCIKSLCSIVRRSFNHFFRFYDIKVPSGRMRSNSFVTKRRSSRETIMCSWRPNTLDSSIQIATLVDLRAAFANQSRKRSYFSPNHFGRFRWKIKMTFRAV